MSSEDEHSRGADRHPIIPVESERIVVGRLKPDIYNHREGLLIPGNLDSLMPEVEEALRKHSGFEALVKDIKEHRRSAIIVTSVGGFTILVAAVAGFEFGIRHGRDLRSIKGLFPQKKKK